MAKESSVSYMVQGDGRSNVVLSMVTMSQFIMPFIRSSVLRVQAITMTNYICLHVYWFAVVFCLVILGELQMNENSNPNSNSNSKSHLQTACT